MKTLRAYQRDALRYCLGTANPALFMEMRLGKTLVAVRAAKAWHDVETVLVVAPYSALQGWREELREEGELVYNLVGERNARLRKMIAASRRTSSGTRKWGLINKEGWLWLPEIGWVVWDLVVLDESVFIKEPRAGVTKFFTGKRVKMRSPVHGGKMWTTGRFREARHRMILTGDPQPNSELDYFTQLDFLDPSIIGSKSYWDFRLDYFTQKAYNWVIMAGGKRALAERLAGNCFFLRRKDAGLGVQRIREKRMILLPRKFREQYSTMEDELLLEAHGKVLDKTIYAGVAWNWMRRMCGGFLDAKFVWDGKIKELMYLLGTDLRGQQAVVYCHYVNELLRVSDALSEAGKRHGLLYREVPRKKRETVISDFTSGRSAVLLAQPDLVKYGSNFSAASTIVYYSQCSGSDARNQSEARCERVGKDDSTLVVDLLVEDTVEVAINESHRLRENGKQLFRRIVKGIQERRAHEASVR